MARSGDLGGAAQTFEALRAEVARLALELDEYLQQNAPSPASRRVAGSEDIETSASDFRSLEDFGSLLGGRGGEVRAQ